MGYTIQIGAFTQMSNAVRLTQKLQTQGVSAYHFLHDSGLYKVRFGNYASKDSARKRAEKLHTKGIIESYYLVSPDEYAAGPERQNKKVVVRDSIVSTAQQYIGASRGCQPPQPGRLPSGLLVAYRVEDPGEGIRLEAGPMRLCFATDGRGDIFQPQPRVSRAAP